MLAIQNLLILANLLLHGCPCSPIYTFYRPKLKAKPAEVVRDRDQI